MQVIPTILADAGQVLHAGDAKVRQACLVADARELEQLRTLDGPRADDHFA